jgi:hypothetical protein
MHRQGSKLHREQFADTSHLEVRGSKLHREQFADTSHLQVCRRRRVVSLLTFVVVGSRVPFTFVVFWVCFPDLLKNPAYY